jgi:hypothetical protein
MTTSPSLKKKHPRFFSERIHAPADSFISENEGMNESSSNSTGWSRRPRGGL